LKGAGWLDSENPVLAPPSFVRAKIGVRLNPKDPAKPVVISYREQV
jgi:hypothetical protein